MADLSRRVTRLEKVVGAPERRVLFVVLNAGETVDQALRRRYGLATDDLRPEDVCYVMNTGVTRCAAGGPVGD